MTKEMTLILLAIFSVFACGTSDQKIKKIDTLSDNTEQIKSNTTLQTGWYYIVDNGSGKKRQLERDSSYYFIDPKPIVTARNITEMQIYESNYGDIGLSMQLDSRGTDLWSGATEKATGRQLGFVFNDKLLHAPRLNSQIPNGMTALNNGKYSKQELEKLKKEIEKEIR
jgi:preprotein translocase subunit SecD